MPLPALPTEPPHGSHWWTVDHHLVEDVVNGWIVRSPTGRGWARCSCGLRIEGPTGESVPLAQVEAELVDHLGSVPLPSALADQLGHARAIAGDVLGVQADDDARETGP
jgi:hypothetical protein